MSSTKPIAYLFPTTSRAQTPNAPPYDSTRKVKSWVDPNPGPGPTATYQMLDPQGKIIHVTMPISEASTLNLPGHPDYPVYVNPKSTATYALSGAVIYFGVSLLSDAQTLAKTFGLTDTAIFDELAHWVSLNQINWPANDPRRAYGITFANRSVAEVALLLAEQNANGIGAPGEWKQDSSGDWFWQSELASDTPITAVMPLPIAPLAANEHIEMGGGLGSMPVIVVDDPTPAPSSGGSFHAATDPTILKLLEGVNAIRGLLHV